MSTNKQDNSLWWEPVATRGGTWNFMCNHFGEAISKLTEMWVELISVRASRDEYRRRWMLQKKEGELQGLLDDANKELNRAKDAAGQIVAALALHRSMALSGEQPSEGSENTYRTAIANLNALTKSKGHLSSGLMSQDSKSEGVVHLKEALESKNLL